MLAQIWPKLEYLIILQPTFGNCLCLP